MFCAGFHDINSCRLDAGMTEQVRQFRDIFFEVVKCPRKQEIGYGEIENILKTAGKSWKFRWKTAKRGGGGGKTHTKPPNKKAQPT